MIPSISRLLFTTDLSMNSTNALRQVIGLARSTGAEMHILHVCEALSADAEVTLQLFVQDADARQDALTRRSDFVRARLAQRQEEFWSSLAEEDRAVRAQVVATDVIEGFPAEVILREAVKRKCDLIVLGAHEHALSHSFLGSVAKRVLRRATIPTLIIPNLAR